MISQNNITKLSLLLFAFFLATVGIGQTKGNLKGIVTDGYKNLVTAADITITNKKTKKSISKKSDLKGEYEFTNVIAGVYAVFVKHPNFNNFLEKEVIISKGKTTELNIKLNIVIVPAPPLMDEIRVVEMDHEVEENEVYDFSSKSVTSMGIIGAGNRSFPEGEYHNTEGYAAIEENGYKLTTTSPLSTFSVDVDAASYSNVRRFLLSGQKPEKGAIRIEEMINYFHYDYPEPEKGMPFSITTEVGECPWSNNKLVHIGLQGERIEKENLPASNLVFLLDVSGSMDQPSKLPLLKKSFRLLVNELSERDRIAIVVYAGAAGVVLNSTSAANSSEILDALGKLNAGGSTAGGAGIELAYKVAQENFIENGNNRVILATDGDFNIGMRSNGAMQDLIENKRKTGIFLTCLGFGTGNIQDEKMEILADKGNGNYAYIDNVLEAKKVLVTEIGATLITLAKDVKIQVEFNPNIVSSYRLIGYENRLLNNEDFNDDKKDAGEIGAGHSVTALYEVVMKGEGDGQEPTVDPLRYQQNGQTTNNLHSDELLTVKFRYKAPDGDVSKLIERNLKNNVESWNRLSENFKFSAAVAGFGMLLRESEHKGTLMFDRIMEMAKENLGEDENGYRAEFIRLVDAAKIIYG